MEMELEGLACTLSGPELVQRIHEWREIASRALSRTVEGNSVVTIYPLEDELRRELDRLIEAEKDCCSFMTFEVAEGKNELVVKLSVPNEMRHVLALMLEMAGGKVRSTA